MINTTFRAVIATCTILSASHVFHAEADAASNGRSGAFKGRTAIVTMAPGRPARRGASVNISRHAITRRSATGLRARVKRKPALLYGTFGKTPRTGELTAATVPNSEPKPTSEDLMAGICNGAGGGASSNPDGTVSCVDPDGNDALPPVPAPRPD